jgi:UDP-glucose 4-epimerase
MPLLNEQLKRRWSKACVFVTGAAGFIGSHLSERLAQLGADLTLIDDYSNATLPPGQLVAGQRVLNMRVCSPDLARLMNTGAPEVIFHLAANAYASGSVADPVRDMTANLISTFELLENLKNVRFSGLLVFASSAAVYGEPQHLPVTEDHLTCPISPYGVSKLGAERYISVYTSLYGIPAVCIRLFSTYGPRQRKQVIYDLVTKVRDGESPVLLCGNGTQIRDLVYVSDVVEGMLLAAGSALRDGSVYNLCSGLGISIRQLAEEVSSILDSRASIEFSGVSRRGDPNCLIGSPTKLAALGFVPEVSLSDGLRRTVDWFVRANIASGARAQVPQC